MKIEDVKPGMWLRNKLSDLGGHVFVLYLTDTGGFKYHVEQPYVMHPRLSPGWVTSGECYAIGVENYEPAKRY